MGMERSGMVPGDFQRLAGCGSVTGSNIAAIYAMSRDELRIPLYQPEDGEDPEEQGQVSESDGEHVSIYETRIYGIPTDREIRKRL